MKILVCVDQASEELGVLEFAATLAVPSAVNPQASEVTLLHAVEFTPDLILGEQLPEAQLTPQSLGDLWITRAKSRGEAVLHAAQSKLVALGVPVAKIGTKLVVPEAVSHLEARKVAAAACLLGQIEAGGYGIVVIGRRSAQSDGIGSLGGVTEKILRGAKGVSVCVIDQRVVG